MNISDCSMMPRFANWYTSIFSNMSKPYTILWAQYGIMLERFVITLYLFEFTLLDVNKLSKIPLSLRQYKI